MLLTLAGILKHHHCRANELRQDALFNFSSRPVGSAGSRSGAEGRSGMVLSSFEHTAMLIAM